MITAINFIQSDQDGNKTTVKTFNWRCQLLTLDKIKAEVQSNRVTFSLPEEKLAFVQPPNYVKTINGVGPLEFGNFFILGSSCISIYSPSETSESSSSEASESELHQVGLFDGCGSCEDCTQQIQLQGALEDCLIWLNGLKDCLLQKGSDAIASWNNQKLDKIIEDKPDCGYISPLGDYPFGVHVNDHSVAACQMFKQYKVLVNLWNYVVQNKTGLFRLQRAPEDYAGFVVQAKKNFNTCNGGESTSRVTLTFEITMLRGQNYNYRTEQNFGIVIYVERVDENTYIRKGLDSQAPVYQITNNDNISDSKSGWRNQQTSFKLQIIFKPNKPGIYIYSGAFKILPLLIDGTTPDNVFISLTEWLDKRKAAKDITEDEQSEENIWNCKATWSWDDYSDSDTKNYTSGFMKHPPRGSDSNSSG